MPCRTPHIIRWVVPVVVRLAVTSNGFRSAAKLTTTSVRSAPLNATNAEVNFLSMTASNGNIFRVTGPLCGEFTGPGEFPTQRPVTRSFDVYFDLRLNKRLSKQPWGWWFETLSWSLWRQCNVMMCSWNVVSMYIQRKRNFGHSFLNNINSLWPWDVIWWNMSGFTLPHVVDCCLRVQSHTNVDFSLMRFYGIYLWVIHSAWKSCYSV